MPSRLPSSKLAQHAPVYLDYDAPLICHLSSKPLRQNRLKFLLTLVNCGVIRAKRAAALQHQNDNFARWTKFGHFHIRLH